MPSERADYEVIELGAGKGDRPVNDVHDDDRPLVRVAEPDHRGDSLARGAPLAAATVVPWLLLTRQLCRAHLLQLLLRAVAVIGLVLAEELRDHFRIAVETARLIVRALVVIEPEPCHAVENHAYGFIGRSLAIGVLDPQNELATHAPRVQPAEKRGTHAADVQQAGGARGESGADAHGRWFWIRTRRHTGPAR